MIYLDGKSLSQSLLDDLKSRVQAFKKKHSFVPGLAVFLVGEDLASEIYVKQKIKQCSFVGFHSLLKKFPKDIKAADLKKEIEKLNQDARFHGILIQLPLPSPLKESLVLSWLDPRKDVDGLTLENKALLWSGQKRVVPCTPLGIIKLLKHYQIPLEGQKVVVIGRSQIVGLPMVQQLLSHQATVTICHSKTQNLKQECLLADIVISCAGKKSLLNKDFFKKGAVVVDVGIHREIKDGKTFLKGDVNAEGLKGHLKALSPVPKGVGPMTIVMLLENTFQLAELSLKENQ